MATPILGQDGNWYIVTTDGSGHFGFLQVAAPNPPFFPQPSTVLMSYTVQWARTQARMIPMLGVGGMLNEPALTICNNVLQFMLTGGVGPTGDAVGPFPWKFNRVEAPAFQSIQNGQDYISSMLDFGWLEDVIAEETQSTADIKPVIPIMPVRNLRHSSVIGEPARLAVMPFNSQASQLILTDAASQRYVVLILDNGTVSITPVSSFAPSDSFLFLSDPATPPTTGWQIKVANGGGSLIGQAAPNFPPVYAQSYPMATSPSFFQSGLTVSNTGVVSTITPVTTPPTFMWRLDKPAGSLIYTFHPIYQRKPSIATNLSSTWSPFPDQYQYIYNQGVLAFAKKQAKLPDWEEEMKQFIAMISAAVGYGDIEMQDQGASPDRMLLIG